MHAPTLSLQPKSDVSDFGHLTERPNSNKSEFGCKRGGDASIACDPRDSADRYLRAWVCTLSVTGVPARTASSERSSAGMSCLGPSTFSPRPPQVSTTFS